MQKEKYDGICKYSAGPANSTGRDTGKPAQMRYIFRPELRRPTGSVFNYSFRHREIIGSNQYFAGSIFSPLVIVTFSMSYNEMPQQMQEPLDFCRVKKIDEKGYGFLKGLYYQRDVFFHFNQIKNEAVKEQFERLKRGDFLIYFTSKLLPDGKRKATQIWYALADTPQELRPAFAHRIITDFETGRVNLFDLFYAYKELKEEKVIGIEATERILRSKRLQSVPTTVIPYLLPEEIPLFKEIMNIEEWRTKEDKPFWFEEVEKL